MAPRYPRQQGAPPSLPHLHRTHRWTIQHCFAHPVWCSRHISCKAEVVWISKNFSVGADEMDWMNYQIDFTSRWGAPDWIAPVYDFCVWFMAMIGNVTGMGYYLANIVVFIVVQPALILLFFVLWRRAQRQALECSCTMQVRPYGRATQEVHREPLDEAWVDIQTVGSTQTLSISESLLFLLCRPYSVNGLRMRA